MNIEEILTAKISREIDREIMIKILQDADTNEEYIENFKKSFDEDTENRINRMILGSNKDIHPI